MDVSLGQVDFRNSVNEPGVEVRSGPAVEFFTN
jgi:hypothetical protein